MALEARPIADIVRLEAPTVTRAEFLSWTFDAFGLDKSVDDCTLPYVRYPRGLKETLCSAKEAGALQQFGLSQQYNLSRPITRGEALVALTALLIRREKSDVSAFADVKTAEERQAVMNAVALHWMKPVSTHSFGMKKRLTGTAAFDLLTAVMAPAVNGGTRTTITINGIPGGANVLPKQELLNAVWDILHRQYLHPEKMKPEEAAYRAIEGVVNSLGDPYTTFFPPESASNFESQMKGELTGIGAHIEAKDGVIVIVAPLTGSPAEKAGLLPGDAILEVNGTDLMGLTVDRAASFIRGEIGTTAALKIRRNGTELNIAVVRALITIPEITLTWQGDIAVLALAQFGDTTAAKIRGIVSEISAKSPRGLVLDLRNNGGGLLSAADTVVSNFVPRGSVVAKVQGRTATESELTQGDPTLSVGVKMVVLVNKGSASASEIVAGALQDYGRAIVVGTQTFGKGSVQEIYHFETGEAVKVTKARWLTPKGRTIEGKGITPDVVIEKSDGKDEQMEKALALLRS